MRVGVPTRGKKNEEFWNEFRSISMTFFPSILIHLIPRNDEQFIISTKPLCDENKTFVHNRSKLAYPTRAVINSILQSIIVLDYLICNV